MFLIDNDRPNQQYYRDEKHPILAQQSHINSPLGQAPFREFLETL